MAPITNQDELQTLLPSLSPIMSSGADPEDVLTSGDPYGYLSAYRAGVPYRPKGADAFTPAPMPSALATAAPQLEPLAKSIPAPAGTAAIQQGEREQANPAAPGLGIGLVSQAPSTNAPNPPSESTATPAVPATVNPTGTATPAGPGWSQLARQSAQRAQGALEDAAQLASQRQPVDVNALEAQRAKLAAPASSENPGGVPNAKDPNHPEYRPSVGRRIARGVLGAAAGLAEGGIRGALLGGLEPAATTGVAYGAPTSRFAADAQRNQQAIDSLDQQLKQADTQAKTRDQAVQDKLLIAAQFAGLTKDEAQALKGDNDRAKIEATVAKAGQKAEWNPDGTLKDIVDDPDSAMFKSRKAMDDLRSAQQEQAEARAALAKAQNDPGSPAYKLAKQRADIANANAAAAQTRADAYMLNAYGANLGTTPQGAALPGATQTTEGAPMGSRFQSQFTKHEGAVAQFNDVGGALDNLEKAARAMVASGQRPDNSLIAAALAQPEGTATKWIQGQVAKSNLTPEQRDYVINLVSARENLQALRKAGGLPGSTEAQVDRLMEMLPDASTPDLDYFLRQTGQIKQTRERLAAGIPNVVGGTAVETGNKPHGNKQSGGPPKSVVDGAKEGQYIHGPNGQLYQKKGGKAVEVKK